MQDDFCAIRWTDGHNHVLVTEALQSQDHTSATVMY